jgi:DNA-binding response OmpR family regulator
MYGNYEVLVALEKKGRPPRASVRSSSVIPDAVALHEPDARVLVVDDEPAICQIVQAFLEEEGIACDAAHSGRAALQAFAGKPSKYEVVITDLRMEGIDGLELSKALREISPSTHVALMTGLVPAGLERSIGTAGYPDLVLRKPFTRLELLACLAVASRRAFTLNSGPCSLLAS